MQIATQGRYNPIIDKILYGEDHLSFSSLCAFHDSPRTFIEYKTGQKVTTDAMIYGSMVHCLVLQPELFESRYFAIDDTNIIEQIGGAKPRATTKYKDWLMEKKMECGERQMIDTSDYYHAIRISKNVKENKASKKLLDRCPDREKGIEWEFNNFKFKGFIDADGDEDIFDLKTTTDAEPRIFHRNLVYDLYHMQGAMYVLAEKLKLGKAKRFHHIAVDKKGGISVHELDRRLLEAGLSEYKRLISGFNQCILEERWNENYDFWAERFDGIYVAEKPGWMY